MRSKRFTKRLEERNYFCQDTVVYCRINSMSTTLRRQWRCLATCSCVTGPPCMLWHKVFQSSGVVWVKVSVTSCTVSIVKLTLWFSSRSGTTSITASVYVCCVWWNIVTRHDTYCTSFTLALHLSTSSKRIFFKPCCQFWFEWNIAYYFVYEWNCEGAVWQLTLWHHQFCVCDCSVCCWLLLT